MRSFCWSVAVCDSYVNCLFFFLSLCVDGLLVCAEGCTQVTGVMAMMMTGRVLLVCALCALWCGAGGVYARDRDSNAVGGCTTSGVLGTGLSHVPSGCNKPGITAALRSTLPVTAVEASGEEINSVTMQNDLGSSEISNAAGPGPAGPADAAGAGVPGGGGTSLGGGGTDEIPSGSSGGKNEPAPPPLLETENEALRVTTVGEDEAKKAPQNHDNSVEHQSGQNQEHLHEEEREGEHLQEEIRDQQKKQEQQEEEHEESIKQEKEQEEKQHQQHENSAKNSEEPTKNEAAVGTNATASTGDSDGSTAVSHTTSPLLLLLLGAYAAAAAVVAA
ncbi:Mucin-associated surface protein (MASP) subgroup S052 [Trypanosoma cruzi]|uniref:Mucin-associated surface protein (MASP) subgroup S052 n=1 Tax=Trypanosoma cruzi TaxID=5693 RepID=A0A7J6XY99_TRYCR|nr:Mucin-associated surface protein (MASP) subgroup S052 [Trypanosoma cruzi]